MSLLISWLILTLAVWATAALLPGFQVKDVKSALIVAAIFGLLNFFLGWFLKALLVLPAILTLGVLFLFIPFIVNTMLLWLTDKLIGSFQINTLGGLLLSAAAITIVNAVFFHYVHHAHRLSQMYPGVPRWI